MATQSAVERIQRRLDAVTKKWWLYVLLLLLFLIPSYASKGFDPTESMDLVGEVLAAPLIFTYPALMPIAKAIPAALIAGVMLFGNTMRRAFNGYVAALYLALALFQTSAVTDTYGFAVISGNLALVMVVALVWIWEVAAGRNDFTSPKRSPWRWWVVPVALVAFLAPIDASTMSADFRLVRLLTNESGLTYCMMTPVVLALLTLFYPTVNLAVLRVSSFAGLMFGVLNMITWFVVTPSGWWMGVLHVPLVAISLYAFVLGHLKGAAWTGVAGGV